jgi:hypothetical protein
VHQGAGLDAETLGGVAGGDRAGGSRRRPHHDDRLAAQRRILLLFARRKEGVEPRLRKCLKGYCSCLFWQAVDRVEYVVMQRPQVFDLMIYGPERATAADEKRNRKRPAADLEIGTSASF